MIEEIINEPYYQNKLLDIAYTIKHLDNVEIYIDGSLKDLKKDICSMGIEWFIVNLEINNIKFHASLSSFPSSTKVETYILLTALIVCPINSIVDVYLNSANTINTFNKLFIEQSINNTQILKLPNCWGWKTIEYIIQNLHLDVRLHKVKAYSNNKLNDKADKLAKEGASCSTLIIIISNNVPIHLKFNNNILDLPIYKFWKNYYNAKYFDQFLVLKRNINYKDLIQ